MAQLFALFSAHHKVDVCRTAPRLILVKMNVHNIQSWIYTLQQTMELLTHAVYKLTWSGMTYNYDWR